MDILPPYFDFKRSSFRYIQNEPAKEKSTPESSMGDPLYDTKRTTIIKLQYDARLKEFSRFNNWEPDHLITQVISDYHQNARKNIRTIYEYAGIVSVRHGENHPEVKKLPALLFLHFDDLLFHFTMEEKILFPWILQGTNRINTGDRIPEEGLIKQSIIWRKQEHKKISGHFERLRVLTQNYLIPDDACAAYVFLYETMARFEEDMSRLFHLEEDILFEKVLIKYKSENQ